MLNQALKYNEGVEIYYCSGEIACGANSPSTWKGVGEALVELHEDGRFAVVLYNYSVTVCNDSASTEYFGGLSSEKLHQLNSNIPIILFDRCCICKCQTWEGLMMDSYNGYVGISDITNISTSQYYRKFCIPGRIYNINGDVGGWPTRSLTVGIRVSGVVTGEY